MRSDAHLEFTVTIRTEPLTLIPKAPDRSGWRGAPGRTNWVSATPASTSAFCWANAAAIVTGLIAPARMNGVMKVTCPARA